LKLIISCFDDINNIFHIFSNEIHRIWEVTKGDTNHIILLKNYQDNTVNKWRFDLLKSIYRDVYIYQIDDLTIQKSIEYSITIESFPYNIIDPWTFRKYDKSDFYLGLADKVKSSLGIPPHIGHNITYIYRTNNRILYDSNSKKLLSEVLSLGFLKLKIPFKFASFDQMTLKEQAITLSDTKIMLSVHGASNTNLFLLPEDAQLFEINFRKYWFCDPVCHNHKSGLLKYKDNCHGQLLYRNYFHKADYHNLSQIFGKKYTELEIEDADTFLDLNPINVKNVFIDGESLIEKLKIAYHA
jgi:hypothetical protein